MATNQKISPCPKCKTSEHMGVYKYEASGNTQHVECDRCFYLGPASGSARRAIILHNQKVAAEAV